MDAETTTATRHAAAVPAELTPTPPADTAPSLASRALTVMYRDPVLFVTLGYVSISFVGLWGSWWFYRSFDLPILDYLQASDFLVAGLREPGYAFALAFAVGISWLLTWPDRWRKRNPERAAALRGRWWVPMLMPGASERRSRWRMAPDTGLAFAIVTSLIGGVAGTAIGKAQKVKEGRTPMVEVVMAGEAKPAGRAHLLGTSSAFAFLYWPERRQVEAVTLESVARLRALPRSERPRR